MECLESPSYRRTLPSTFLCRSQVQITRAAATESGATATIGLLVADTKAPGSRSALSCTQSSFACYIKNQPTPQRNLQSIKATKPHTYKVIFVCSTYIPSLHFLERQNPEGVGRESHSAGGSISMTPGGSAPLSWCSCETGRRPSPRYTSSI